MVSSAGLNLTVLTLNIWGIPFVSKDREIRVSAIGKELASGRYDIVSLQEVWSQADYQTLRETTEAVLPYSHYFYSGVIGAGLVVLSKYPIISTLFHAWSVNGYFHRVQHADWFGGKGVGLCRILVDNKIVHLYNAHLHAEYDNENDEYKTHRVIQAFDTAQFIKATRGKSALQILAGDLNTKPEDLSYKMLLYTSKMEDCCAAAAISTNECHRNSYTPKKLLDKNPNGIRIDHIFLRHADSIQINVEEHTLPFPDRVPGQKFSYSDHEAVMIKLSLHESQEKSAITSLRASVSKTSSTSENEACFVDEIATANGIINGGEPHCAAAAAAAVLPVQQNTLTKRIAVLHESIALCDTALQQLKVDRVLYFSVTIFLLFFLVALAEFPAPTGLKTIMLLFKLLFFAGIIFTLFMGSIWNFIEQNGILSAKIAMQVVLQRDEKDQFDMT